MAEQITRATTWARETKSARRQSELRDRRDPPSKLGLSYESQLTREPWEPTPSPAVSGPLTLAFWMQRLVQALA